MALTYIYRYLNWGNRENELQNNSDNTTRLYSLTQNLYRTLMCKKFVTFHKQSGNKAN